MLALERDLGDGEDWLGRAGLSGEEEDAFAVDECALLDAAGGAEPEDLRFGAGGELLGFDVFGVEDQVVLGALLLGDFCLGVAVTLEGFVAVEMVRREVGDEGDMRAEKLGGFELEAGDFEDVPGKFGAGGDEFDDG